MSPILREGRRREGGSPPSPPPCRLSFLCRCVSANVWTRRRRKRDPRSFPLRCRENMEKISVNLGTPAFCARLIFAIDLPVRSPVKSLNSIHSMGVSHGVLSGMQFSSPFGHS